MKKLLLFASTLALLCGCTSFREEYKKQVWTPDAFNYTLQRDRTTGDMSDYFGLSWSFK